MLQDDVFLSVRRIVGEVMDIDPADLTGDTRFSDLPLEYEEDFHDIYERCCQALNVPLPAILNTMPVYRQRIGEQMMNGWRLLAPFFARADRLLAEHDVRMECETLDSLAETMRQGRYVSSGQFWPRANPLRSKRYVLGWLAGLMGATVAVPYALTFLPCRLICIYWGFSTFTQMQNMLPVAFAIFLFVLVVTIAPGVYGLYLNPKAPFRQRRQVAARHRPD